LSATVDTNVLIYAANNSDPVHERARDLLERLALDGSFRRFDGIKALDPFA
jgi:predicted nucleic acid-binding protein